MSRSQPYSQVILTDSMIQVTTKMCNRTESMANKDVQSYRINGEQRCAIVPNQWRTKMCNRTESMAQAPGISFMLKM